MRNRISLIFFKSIFIYFIGAFTTICMADTNTTLSGTIDLAKYIKECASSNFSESIQELCLKIPLYSLIVAVVFLTIISFMIYRRVKPFKVSELHIDENENN